MRLNQSEYIGKKIGKLTILEFKKEITHIVVCVKCECGEFSEPSWSNVKSGRTKSCGCGERKSRFTHGMTGSPTYNSWENMLNRCNAKNKQHKRSYNTISVCEAWLTFENFLKDMGERPKNTSLDRINNGMGYMQENCRWATKREQQQNRTVNHTIFYNGETKCLSEWSRELNIPVTTLLGRLKKWSVKDAFEVPKWKRPQS